MASLVPILQASWEGNESDKNVTLFLFVTWSDSMILSLFLLLSTMHGTDPIPSLFLQNDFLVHFWSIICFTVQTKEKNLVLIATNPSWFAPPEKNLPDKRKKPTTRITSDNAFGCVMTVSMSLTAAKCLWSQLKREIQRLKLIREN